MSFLSAQNRVSGTITDNDGEALIGVNILVKNTSNGTISDIDGSYSIQADPSDYLVFSYVGFLQQEVMVGNQSNINVVLGNDDVTMEEVVVVADFLSIENPQFFNRIHNHSTWGNAAVGMIALAMDDDELMLVKVKFEEGAEGYMHQHYHSQVTYVESGEFKMTIGDQVKVISAGDSYYIPTDIMHGCICLKPGVLLDVFSPAREDFLPELKK